MVDGSRCRWLMRFFRKLTSLLDAGDIIIDGGNSYYHDDIRRGAELSSTEFIMSMSEQAVASPAVSVDIV